MGCKIPNITFSKRPFVICYKPATFTYQHVNYSMKHFREYSAAMQQNIAQQVRAQAKESGSINQWVNALYILNPELNAYPNHPAQVVGEVALLVHDNNQK